MLEGVSRSCSRKPMRSRPTTGISFDIPKLHGRSSSSSRDASAPASLPQIDVYKAVKQARPSEQQAGVSSAPLLGLGDEKLKHEGMELWIEGHGRLTLKPGSQDGSATARRTFDCWKDVYERVKPYIPNHPHLRDTSRASCGACGSAHMQSRGYRRTKASRIQSLQCMDCGSWQQGKVERIAA
jgi:hypothetical protein